MQLGRKRPVTPATPLQRNPTLRSIPHPQPGGSRSTIVPGSGAGILHEAEEGARHRTAPQAPTTNAADKRSEQGQEGEGARPARPRRPRPVAALSAGASVAYRRGVRPDHAGRHASAPPRRGFRVERRWAPQRARTAGVRVGEAATRRLPLTNGTGSAATRVAATWPSGWRSPSRCNEETLGPALTANWRAKARFQPDPSGVAAFPTDALFPS